MNSEIDKVISRILQWRKLIIVTNKKVIQAEAWIDEQYALAALENLKKEINRPSTVKNQKRRRNRK